MAQELLDWETACDTRMAVVDKRMAEARRRGERRHTNLSDEELRLAEEEKEARLARWKRRCDSEEAAAARQPRYTPEEIAIDIMSSGRDDSRADDQIAAVLEQEKKERE